MEENPTWLCVVAAVLRRRDGLILVHRRPRHKQHGGLWEFPGGKVESGESPADALVRELEEELAIVAGRADLSPLAFAEQGPADGLRGIVILLYSLERWEGEPRAMEVGATLAWHTADEIAALAMPPLDVALRNLVFAGAARIGSAR